jgi:hypothetical protein
MNRDSFEMHKGNKIYPLVAEVDVVNSKPLFVRDDLGLFSGVYFEDDTLSLVWLKKEFILKDIEFLRAVFFVNKVPIEEHIFTIPHNQEGTAWWSHPYMEKMRGKMSIKFYGC